MVRYLKSKAFAGLMGAAAALAVFATFAMSASAQDKKPIKIGFGMAQTGPLGPNGKSAMLAMDIWVEEINAKGGLLGRPVELVHYDDQSNPSTVPGIYTKLLDVDKVDVIVGGYGTNMLAPAMPIVMQRKKTFLGLFGLGVNHEFNYDRYFAMIPTGPTPTTSFTEGFFDTAMAHESEAKDGRDRGRRRRVLQERLRRCAHQRQEGGPEDRLRQELSAFHHRFLADRARDPGDQSGPGGDLLLSARLGRHGAGGQRSQVHAEDDRRRHGRPAIDRVQGEARSGTQRLHELRLLAAGKIA